MLGINVTSLEARLTPYELSAKIHALLFRRKSGVLGNGKAISIENLVVYLDTLEIRVLPAKDRKILTLKESLILRTLAKKPDQCISREELSRCAWGTTKVSPRTLDSHISRLRKRLEGAELSILSVYGQGYKLARNNWDEG